MVEHRFIGKGLITEALVIVVGILLAFSIQAWWEEAQETEEAGRLMAAILEEYERNIAAGEENLKFRQAVIGACNQLLSLNGSNSNIESKLLDDLIGALSWAIGPNVTWAALDTLTEGGKLSLVEDTALRTKLVALQSEKRRFNIREQSERVFVENVLNKFLRENTLLPQIAKSPSALTIPGGDGTAQYDYEFELGVERDHRNLINDSEFLGIVLEMLWIQHDWVNRIEAYKAVSVSIIPQLKQAVDNS
jgi:hypothetical protein